MSKKQFWSYQRNLLWAILLTGLVAGLGGILLHDVLQIVEKLAFGHTEETVSILTNKTGPWRRLLSLMSVAFLSAFGWYFLQNHERKIVSIADQVDGSTVDSIRPVFWAHLLHVLLQIISVGAGSPVGKEAAPRELGAISAGRLADFFHLRLSDRRLLIACGAAAGLAAVYQVPIASIFFVFETLAIGFSLRNALMVALTTCIAALVANPVISDLPLYQTAKIVLSFNGVLLAVFVGLLIAPLASYFRFWTQRAVKQRIKDQRIWGSLPLTFFFIGLLAIFLPELLGNGSAMAQLAFKGISLKYAFMLVIVKAVIVPLTLKNGAYGGTLTPSFALGALLGFIIVTPFQFLSPSFALSTAMLSGAAAFLAITMQAPLTAVGLVVSFTGQSYQALIPLTVAAITALAVNRLIIKQK